VTVGHEFQILNILSEKLSFSNCCFAPAPSMFAPT